ncbi:protein maelstrom 1 [Stomoxys calcitrans]|uniref:protein maelstrom 1 n=1 Tax=Stomoxys calcitrans TaxID=35570 RepID=UPI0027E302B3|nr:protein maelstrom 1 [Stomoxys calcitrans]
MPTKKKQKPNAFMLFALDWRSKQARPVSISEAIQEAGEIWKKMNAEERAPYKERQKEELHLTNRSAAEKFTCTGIPISQIEQEKLKKENKELRMKHDIESFVGKSVKENKLEHQPYYFVMVNYFTKTLKGGVYVPAELALCKFSLQEGVSSIYQTLINPDINIYGHHYEAQHHSETTHNLPLPPKALGEKNLSKIYKDILDFIGDNDTNSYPPIYTDRESRHIVESVLNFLRPDKAENVELKVYPIQYLFFIMKEATCQVGELEKLKNIYITDAYFERDYFEYHIGIGCQYHENIDKSKYCTQSYVTRWGFMFADYMCQDLAIPLKPGRHCPINTNLEAILTKASNTSHDNESLVSMTTSLTYATAPVAGSKLYDNKEDDRASTSAKIKLCSLDQKPSKPEQGTKKKHKATMKPSLPILQSHTHEEDNANPMGGNNEQQDDEDLNPWNLRSLRTHIPPEPDSSCFDIDYNSCADLSDYDDYNSVASFGRGRGSLISYVSSTSSGSLGRGQLLSYLKN